jgi:hypothetical protein
VGEGGHQTESGWITLAQQVGSADVDTYPASLRLWLCPAKHSRKQPNRLQRSLFLPWGV